MAARRRFSLAGAMSETETDEIERKRPYLVPAVVLVFALVLYPLSIGPVCWLFWRGHLPESTGAIIEVAYAPPLWLAHQAETGARIFTWYIKLFVTSPR